MVSEKYFFPTLFQLVSETPCQCQSWQKGRSCFIQGWKITILPSEVLEGSWAVTKHHHTSRMGTRLCVQKPQPSPSMKTPGSGEERKGDGLREMKVSSAKRVQSRGSLQGQAAKRADEVGQARRNRMVALAVNRHAFLLARGSPNRLQPTIFMSEHESIIAKSLTFQEKPEIKILM